MTLVKTLRDNTPLETYFIRDVPVLVKREDLSWPFPPLSKARGVWAAIESRPNMNVAVVDTGRSLNGQLAATIGMTLGRKVICGYPQYVSNPEALPGAALAIRSLGVELLPIPANRQFMMRSYMDRFLTNERSDDGSKWFLLPTGLRLPETVDATEREAKYVPAPGTLVVPTGTGTHLAGLLRAFLGESTDFIAVQGYAREETRFRRDVQRMARVEVPHDRLRVVDLGFEYYEVRANLLPPFPAHLHYEVRAWKWLHSPGVVESLKQPIVLWNIGA